MEVDALARPHHAFRPVGPGRAGRREGPGSWEVAKRGGSARDNNSIGGGHDSDESDDGGDDDDDDEEEDGGDGKISAAVNRLRRDMANARETNQHLDWYHPTDAEDAR